MTTHAIVLCAGFGTRLKPLTDVTPKPAIPFLGHPMVWYALRALKETGLTTFAANVHHLPDKMAACLSDCAKTLGIPDIHIYRENGEILGTGGGARSCFSLIPTADHYIIYHGDVLCGADLNAAIHEHIQAQCDVSLILAPRPQNSKLGMIGVDANGHVAQIRDWYRADVSARELLQPACFTGIHIVKRQLLESLEPEKNICLVTEIYRQMLAQNLPIHAIMTQAFFADIGTPDTFLEAQTSVCEHPDWLPGALPAHSIQRSYFGIA